ncbi:ABC transporter permease [Rhodococcus fascians]|nr:ABC transporter permease [Rhodococcus fascians]MBY4116486.1 ABC transporter permease [Rhodococcus fascians]
MSDLDNAVATPPVTLRSNRPTLGGLLSRYAVVGIWILLAGLYAILRPDSFLQYGTFRAIFGSQQGQALMFLGLALVVVFVVGEFDLSVASNLGLAATIVPVLNVNHGVPVLWAAVAAVAASVAVGSVNGLFTVKLGINPIVVTLGMATLLSGIALLISNSNTISGLSSEFASFTSTTVLGLPLGFYYGVAAAVLAFYVLSFTPLGRHMSFVGSNPEVARLAAVPVTRIRIGAYMVAGLLCGLGGVILVSSLGSYDPASSGGLLLPAFSAAFLGTAIVQPGRFNPLGMVIGVYFLATGILGLQILGYTGWISNVFYGGALILAVTASTLVRRRTSEA